MTQAIDSALRMTFGDLGGERPGLTASATPSANLAGALRAKAEARAWSNDELRAGLRGHRGWQRDSILVDHFEIVVRCPLDGRVKERLDSVDGLRLPHAHGARAVGGRQCLMELEMRWQCAHPLLCAGPECLPIGDLMLSDDEHTNLQY